MLQDRQTFKDEGNLSKIFQNVTIVSFFHVFLFVFIYLFCNRSFSLGLRFL